MRFRCWYALLCAGTAACAPDVAVPASTQPDHVVILADGAVAWPDHDVISGASLAPDGAVLWQDGQVLATSDTPTLADGEAAPLTIETFETELVAHQCAMAKACDSSEDLATCVARAGGGKWESAEVAAKVAQGTLIFDAAAAAMCIAQMPAADVLCGVSQTEPAICARAVHGSLPGGAACVDGASCASGWCGKSWSPLACPDTCAPVAQVGDPCEYLCFGGLYCVNGKCAVDKAPVVYAKVGQPCTPACEPGLYCRESGDWTCQAKLAPGVACNGDKDQCVDGYSCLRFYDQVSGVQQPATCAAVAKAGEACSLSYSIQGSCEANYRCESVSSGKAYPTHCVWHPAKVANGQPCTEDGQCYKDAGTCLAGANGKTCVAWPGDGETCAEQQGFSKPSFRCAPGFTCDPSTIRCVAYLGWGEACSSSGIDCAPLFRCVPGANGQKVCGDPVSGEGGGCTSDVTPSGCGPHLHCDMTDRCVKAKCGG